MADEEGAAQEAPPEGEAAPSPSKVAPPPSASKAAVAAASKAAVAAGSKAAVAAGSKAAVASASKAAVPPSASKAAVPPSASQAAVPPSVSKAGVAPSPSKAEAEAGQKPSKVEAAATPSKVEAAATPSKVEAAATPSKVEAAATPSKVQAAPTPSKVEAAPQPSKADTAPGVSKVEVGEGPEPETKPSVQKEAQRKSRSKMSLTAGSRQSVMAGRAGRTASRQSLMSIRESLTRIRPASRTFQRSGSFISFRRSSLGFDKMKAMYENSYVLGPKKPFSYDRVSVVIRELLDGEELVYPEHYDPDSARKLAHDVAAVLRANVKDLGFDRYRLVCLCEVVDNRGQTAAHGMRFLWDAERDNFACYTVEKMYYYLTATVFGIYTD